MFASHLVALRSVVRHRAPVVSQLENLFPTSTLDSIRYLTTSKFLRLNDDNNALNQQRQQQQPQQDSQQQQQQNSTSSPTDQDATKISVTFTRPDGTKVSVKSSQDKSLYDAVIDNNVDIDGFGACEGTLCCTTCHLIFKEADFEKVGPPTDEELDMLDLAYGLTDTSRLGCQVILKKEFDPLEVQVPASINDTDKAIARYLAEKGPQMFEDRDSKRLTVSLVVHKLMETWRELPEEERNRYYRED